MPKKGGKRAAHSRDAGAKGGRTKKTAAADVVLQQPTAELPVKGAAVLGRPPKKEDAAPRVRRADDQITCAEASAGLGMPLVERPRGSPPASGVLFPAPFPFFCLHLLPSLCSRAGKQDLTIFNAMPFAWLKREQVEQEFVFLNTLFLSKETQGSNQSRSTK